MANGNGAKYLPGGGEGSTTQWWGMYFAYIAVNADPLAQGRVKLRVPQVFGPTTSGWASPMVPLTYIPKVGTPVTCMFIGGDPSQPVWFGNFALPNSAAGFVFLPTEPPDPTLGEVWVNTTDGLMSEWNGSGWVAYQIGGSAVQTGIALAEPNINGGVITGAEFIGDGTGNEMILYDGTAAANNISLSVTSEQSTDASGNVILGGTTVYVNASGETPVFFALNIAEHTGIDEASNTARISLFTSDTGQNGWGTADVTLDFSGNGLIISSDVGVQISASNGVLIGGGGPGATSVVSDSWHDLRPLSNSFNGTVSTYYPPQYRINGNGRVEIVGVVGLPGTYNSTTIATLPSAYRPNKTAYCDGVSVVTNSGSAPGNSQSEYLTVDSSGNIQIHGVPSGVSAGPVVLNCSYPLDSTGLIQS